MMVAAYKLMQQLGSSVLIIASTAQYCLSSIALNCGYRCGCGNKNVIIISRFTYLLFSTQLGVNRSAADLIAHNSDYIINSITLNLKYVGC